MVNRAWRKKHHAGTPPRLDTGFKYYTPCLNLFLCHITDTEAHVHIKKHMRQATDLHGQVARTSSPQKGTTVEGAEDGRYNDALSSARATAEQEEDM